MILTFTKPGKIICTCKSTFMFFVSVRFKQGADHNRQCLDRKMIVIRALDIYHWFMKDDRNTQWCKYIGDFLFKKKRNPKSVMTLARNIYSIRMARMG